MALDAALMSASERQDGSPGASAVQSTNRGQTSCVSGDHEADACGLGQARRDTPHQIVHHVIVLVLARTVIRMRLQMSFACPIRCEEVVKQRDHKVRRLPR